MEAIKVDFSDLKNVLDDLMARVKKDDNEWKLTIVREQDCYILEGTAEGKWAIEDDERDELKSHERLLWEVMDYFGFGGSKHDALRLRISRENRDDSTLLQRTRNNHLQ